MARPAKYKTKKDLREAVNRYFKSISYTRTMMAGTVPLLNDDGDEIKVTEYVTPPSISGLCLYLGIDRSTWQNYHDPDIHPEFYDITETARARIEVYLEGELNTRDRPQGIIFNLQNNYGWTDRREVEVGEKTRESIKQNISMSEKLKVIAEAAAAYEENSEKE